MATQEEMGEVVMALLNDMIRGVETANLDIADVVFANGIALQGFCQIAADRTKTTKEELWLEFQKVLATAYKQTVVTKEATGSEKERMVMLKKH